jgi:hypothetical protein
MRQWVSVDPKTTAESLDQVIAATAREACVRDATNLGIRNETCELVAMTRLCSDGVTAQVEDVYTRLGFDPVGRIGVFHRDV